MTIRPPWVALAAQPGTTVIGPDGPAPFGDVFEGRDELVVYSHMFYDGEPWEWQCEGPGVTGVGVQTG